MKALKQRLAALESLRKDSTRYLPNVVPDDTSVAELERLRQLGQCAVRFSEAVEIFLP